MLIICKGYKKDSVLKNSTLDGIPQTVPIVQHRTTIDLWKRLPFPCLDDGYDTNISVPPWFRISSSDTGQCDNCTLWWYWYTNHAEGSLFSQKHTNFRNGTSQHVFLSAYIYNSSSYSLWATSLYLLIFQLSFCGCFPCHLCLVNESLPYFG